MKPARCALGTIALFAFLSLAPAASALPGDTVRVSVDEFGAAGNGPSGEPSVSADGRFVAFASSATNLVPGDTNNRNDVFVHDRATGSIERVSVPETSAAEVGPGETEQGDGESFEASISADGRFVAFTSAATNLILDDTNGRNDVFVHDRLTDTIERVSVGKGGSQSAVHSREPAISADGLRVAFRSASALLPGGNALIDVFVHDRVGGLTERV